MARMDRRICPREAFVRKSFSSGANKFGLLRSILKHVVLQVDPLTATPAILDTLLTQEFDKLSSNVMLSFEAQEEKKRMLHLMTRWLNFEKRMPSSHIIAKDFSNEFLFAGERTSQTVHWLVDRGSVIQAIIFKYKAPEYKSRAKLAENKPSGAYELLQLQRSGEEEAKKLGIDISRKPVFGSIFYMKSNLDTTGYYAPYFEDKLESNIITYCFTQNEAAIVEGSYSAVAPNAANVCDPAECSNCLYDDLCHLKFEKRHLMERPQIALRTIDNVNLTDAQLSFVSFTNGECRVNAVAGSGKTTVVALRTLALIEDGAAPEKILMVTFSEKAKAEMESRVKGFAKGNIYSFNHVDVDKVQVETFNSWGQHMLDEYYHLLGFTMQPSLVDDVVKKDIIIEILEAHRGLPLDYRNPFMSTRSAEGAVTKMVKWIDAMKAAHVETEADVLSVIGANMVSHAAELLAMYNEYNAKLMAVNAIDYEDQLRLLLKLADFGIFEKLEYEHIVVDEFQDSNPNQIAIIVELKRRNKGIKSLVVVGDELQAIYGFRNATPDNLVDFAQYFPNMVDIDMTANFRSQQPIIQLANRIIQKTARLGKVIEAHKKNSHVLPAVKLVDDPDKETDLYCRQIAKFLKKDKMKPNSIAILCRTRAELINLQMALDKYGVPTILKVPEVVADAPYVKAIIALAAFLKDHDDMVSLALYGKSLGQDPFNEKELRDSATAILNVFDVCKTEAEKIDTFLGFCKDASEDYVAEAFLNKMKGLGLHTLKQYLNYCVKYKTYNIRNTQSTAKEDTDCVTLITVHSAKGLEWDNVLLSLKRFPLDEESRRLFYVGVTRARERLLVTYGAKQTILAELLA